MPGLQHPPADPPGAHRRRGEPKIALKQGDSAAPECRDSVAARAPQSAAPLPRNRLVRGASDQEVERSQRFEIAGAEQPHDAVDFAAVDGEDLLDAGFARDRESPQLRARDQLNKGVQAYKNAKYEEAIERFKNAVALESLTP